MSGNVETGVNEVSGVTRIREALGAVAVGEPGLFWVYADPAGGWCVRRDGDGEERRFRSRREARAYMQLQAARCRSYRVIIDGDDGTVVDQSSGGEDSPAAA